MNYTKGKWLRDDPNDDMITVLEMDEEGEDYETYKYIAELNPCGDMRFTDEECEANAKLIVKAPKMYEALKLALEVSHNPAVERILMAALAEVEESQ